MSTETESTAPIKSLDHAADPAHHPNERQYWVIFFVLFAITAVEVALYYFSLPGVNLNNGALGLLGVLKFVAVVGYFMHLKFDSRILRRLFATGLVLAIGVYIVFLLTMGVFISPPDQRP